MLDQAIAPLDRLARDDRVAVGIEDGPRHEVALRIGEDLEELRREGVGEVVEDVFARGDVDRDVRPFGGWDLGEPPVEQRLRSEEHTSALQSLLRISYAVFCLHKQTHK